MGLFIDRLVYKSVPRIILRRRGEMRWWRMIAGWGGFEVKTAIDIYGDGLCGSLKKKDCVRMVYLALET